MTPGSAPLGELSEEARRQAVVVGIDLAGSPARTTGFCRMASNRRVETFPLHTDAEIMAAVRKHRPSLVSVDAPLSLPRGRRVLSDRSGPHFRECDLELRRRGIRFFPLTIGPMRMLTARGIRLKHRMERAGLEVWESYPGGAQDVLNVPRKSAGIPRLRNALVRLGIRGIPPAGVVTHDELDAVTSALVGWLWLEGRGEAIGEASEGQILLPRSATSLRRGVA